MTSSARFLYLDSHATTPVDPRVAEVMAPWMTTAFASASSVHPAGRVARDRVERARESIAGAVGLQADEIVFTSGATESDSLAIEGLAERMGRRRRRIVSIATEHAAVLEPLSRLKRREFDVTLLPVEPAGSSRAGAIDLDRLAGAIDDETLLVSAMLVNNEIGVIQPLAEIARLCRERGALLHTDASQAVGRIPVDFAALDVDLATFTAHKFYGPKGVGALAIRRREPPIRLEPRFLGGGQERRLRAGTLNVPGIVGMEAALTLAVEDLASERRRFETLTEDLYARIAAEVPSVRRIPAPGDDALPRWEGNLMLTFPEIAGVVFSERLPTLCVSSGSACSSGRNEPSHVLSALGLSEAEAWTALRFGLLRSTTDRDVADAAAEVVRVHREIAGNRSSSTPADSS